MNAMINMAPTAPSMPMQTPIGFVGSGSAPAHFVTSGWEETASWSKETPALGRVRKWLLRRRCDLLWAIWRVKRRISRLV